MNEFSLDELYENLLNNAIKIKPSLKKASMFSMPLLLSGISPIFLCTMFPCLLYIGKVYYNFFSIIYKYHICENENIYNSLEYLKFERSYFCLIKELKDMLMENGFNEPMEIFAAYYYLVLNGYLSIEHKFLADNVDTFYHNMGSSIVSGIGVCRNLSFFLNNLINEFDYDSYIVKMRLDSQKLFKLSDEKFELTPFDRISYDRENLLHTFIVHLRKLYNDYNHCAVLLADKDKSYIMDPMNNTFYLINESCVQPYSSGEKISRINLNREWWYKKRIPSVDSTGFIDANELVKTYNQGRLKCDDYVHVFENFYLEHKSLYGDILTSRDVFSKKYVKIKNMLSEIL